MSDTTKQSDGVSATLVARAFWGVGGLLLIVLANAPFRLGHGSLKVSAFEVAIPLLLVGEVARWRRTSRGWTVPSRGLWILVAAWVVWGGISVLWAPDTLLWARRLVVVLEAVGAGATVFLATRRLGALRFAQVVAWAGSVGALVALLWFYALGAPPALNFQPPPDAAASVSQALRLGSPLIGPSNYYATFLLISLPLTMYAAARTTGVLRTTHWVGFALQLAALLSTISRGGAIALVVALVVVAPFVWRRQDLEWKKVVPSLVAMVVLVAFSPRLLTFALARRNLVPVQSAGGTGGTGGPGDTGGTIDLGEALTPSGRLDFIREVFRVIRGHPVFGTGLGNWDAVARPRFAGSAHLALLQVLAELGPVGLLLTLAAIGRVSVEVRRIADRLLRYCVAVALTAVLINSFVEASIEGVAFTWMLGAVVGGVVALPRASQR